MERLTSWVNNKAYAVLNCNNCKHVGSCAHRGGLDYEEMIPCYRQACTELARFEDKLESGQLVELPCKVGDTVWVVIMDCGVWDIRTSKVTAMSIFDKNIILHLKGGDMIDGNSQRIFTDKAQAEAKLKELQSK